MCRCMSTEGGSEDKAICTSNGMECNGNGYCSCGSCICNEGYEGRLCDCIKDNCPRNIQYNSVCSNHGKCDCGVCMCDPEWTGDACDCPVSNATCIDKVTSTVSYKFGNKSS